MATSPERTWRRRGLWGGALLVGSAAWAVRSGGFQHGGSPAGLVYGILAVLAIIVLMTFAARKRAYRSTWGTLEGWMQAHIYIGLLAAVAVLLHTGFHFRDRVAVAAFAVLLAVVLSGVVGVLLYSVVPRRLSAAENNLSPHAIAEQLDTMARAMARLAQSRSDPFQQVCQGLLLESRPGRLAGWRLVLLGNPGRHLAAAAAVGGGSSGDSRTPWAAALPRVPLGEQPELRQLLTMSRQRAELLRRLVVQQRYRNLLDAWLWVHVPLSVALLVVLAAHLVAVFYYGNL